MMSTLLKLGLSGYDVKPRFGAFQCEYLLQNPLFFEEKILVTLDTHTKKMNPPSIILGGGVHGKACWLIAYFKIISTRPIKKIPTPSKKISTRHTEKFQPLLKKFHL